MYTKEEYNQYVKDRSPKSHLAKDTLMAFLFGGAICLISEWIGDLCMALGVSKELLKDVLPVIMVFVGSVLTAFGIYSKIARMGGAGTLVPITGFSNAVTAPAMEFKVEGYILGLGAKIFTVAGPVITYGAITSVACGIIYFLIKTI